ncbi:glycoside hydrolase family 16 protein [Blastococcus mobilis]|uniref:Glycosyl hydrolases family 16 n=1 Tax=Blastococcus mobilis TaxID=1938746 RepID=A0A238Z301_9ACTN|nr:glycoside hydrolase family 16 protein [Blastococcus mobilis]SNR77213.1 Glycosyl hydrolases family 16 [Blastococcus mobilis]
MGVGVTVLVLLLVLTQPWQPAGVRGVSGPPSGWAQVFGDEFTGRKLDADVWQPDREGDLAGIPFNPGIEDAWFDAANVAVADGSLVLTVEERRRTLAGRTYGYSSGMVQSNAAIALRPSRYVEARIRFPGCDGCWPAFWLHPLDRWPPEIDIAEFLESGSESQPHFNYILPSEEKTGPDMYGDPDVDHRDEFHTYGALWEDSRVVPYLDGRPYEEVAATGNVTDLPMMIILNLSVRGGYEPEAGAHMLVDWVRVWAPAEQAG